MFNIEINGTPYNNCAIIVIRPGDVAILKKKQAEGENSLLEALSHFSYSFYEETMRSCCRIFVGSVKMDRSVLMQSKSTEIFLFQNNNSFVGRPPTPGTTIHTIVHERVGEIYLKTTRRS